MCRSDLRRAIVVALFFFISGVSQLPAQWVMVARAASNHIQHMKQKSDKGGYEVATVILAAPANRVYEKAATTLQARSDITITKEDSKNGKIQFEKGPQVVGLQVSALNEQMSQLVVAANISDASSEGDSSKVVDAILRICKEVNVQCTVQGD